MRDGITDDKVHMLRYEMATCNAMGMCTKQQGLRKGGGVGGGRFRSIDQMHRLIIKHGTPDRFPNSYILLRVTPQAVFCCNAHSSQHCPSPVALVACEQCNPMHHE